MTGPRPFDPSTIALAPKVLLHDHLDGGLRPATVLALVLLVLDHSLESRLQRRHPLRGDEGASRPPD